MRLACAGLPVSKHDHVAPVVLACECVYDWGCDALKDLLLRGLWREDSPWKIVRVLSLAKHELSCDGNRLIVPPVELFRLNFIGLCVPTVRCKGPDAAKHVRLGETTLV